MTFSYNTRHSMELVLQALSYNKVGVMTPSPRQKSERKMSPYGFNEICAHTVSFKEQFYVIAVSESS